MSSAFTQRKVTSSRSNKTTIDSDHTQMDSIEPQGRNEQLETVQQGQQEEEEWEKQRDSYKSLADAAFRSSDFPTAISHYTTALTFDPENHILLSNRSAAYLSNKEKSRALADARKCVKLQPEFVKGHSRLASAMLSLGRWSEAKTVYAHILKDMDSENAVAKKGMEDCRIREMREKEKERELVKIAAAAKAAAEERKRKNEEDLKQGPEKQQGLEEGTGKEKGESLEDDDDLLDDFFNEVDEVQTKKVKVSQTCDISNASEINDGDTEITSNTKREKSETSLGSESIKTTNENQIKIQLSDLGTTETQITRLLCPNHEFYNLNPFRVLSISHLASLEALSRRYKALSLLVHPDKITSQELKIKAKEAFEYVRRAMNTLKDEDKARHVKGLVEQGMKQGKRDYDEFLQKNQQKILKQQIVNEEELSKFQEKATLKIFAEIEKRRRDVERRKRSHEQRERAQEDAEVEKLKKERDFEKKWREDERVEKRIGNWRDFQSDGNGRKKSRWG